MRDRKTLNRTLIVYFIIFYIIWALVEFVFVPVTGLDKNPLMYSLIICGIFKCIVWLVPAIMLRTMQSKVIIISNLEL